MLNNLPTNDNATKPLTPTPALVEVSEHSCTSTSSTSSADSTGMWKRSRRTVRFTNTDDPNDVTIHVKYVEKISHPEEIASMHSSPSEQKRYRKSTHDAIQKASLNHQALLLELHNVFFLAETRGNAERMLRILLCWCRDEEHRGLETIILQPLCRDYSSRLCQQWAMFLAVADSIEVHGKLKILENATSRVQRTSTGSQR